jgi:hypothetical protein
VTVFGTASSSGRIASVVWAERFELPTTSVQGRYAAWLRYAQKLWDGLCNLPRSGAYETRTRHFLIDSQASLPLNERTICLFVRGGRFELPTTCVRGKYADRCATPVWCPKHLELVGGLEPPTCCLRGSHSTH